MRIIIIFFLLAPLFCNAEITAEQIKTSGGRNAQIKWNYILRLADGSEIAYPNGANYLSNEGAGFGNIVYVKSCVGAPCSTFGDKMMTGLNYIMQIRRNADNTLWFIKYNGSGLTITQTENQATPLRFVEQANGWYCMKSEGNHLKINSTQRSMTIPQARIGIISGQYCLKLQFDEMSPKDD